MCETYRWSSTMGNHDLLDGVPLTEPGSAGLSFSVPSAVNGVTVPERPWLLLLLLLRSCRDDLLGAVCS